MIINLMATLIALNVNKFSLLNFLNASNSNTYLKLEIINQVYKNTKHNQIHISILEKDIETKANNFYNICSQETNTKNARLESLENCRQSLNIFRSLNRPKDERKVLDQMGNIYLSLGQYRQALDAFEETLKISQSLKDGIYEEAVFQGIGNVYYNLSDFNKALEFYKKATLLRQKKGFEIDVSDFRFLANTYFMLEDFEKSLESNQKALRELNSFNKNDIDDLHDKADIYGMIGSTYLQLGRNKEAHEYYKDMKRMYEKLVKNNNAAVENYPPLLYLGLYSYLAGNYEESSDYYKKAIPSIIATGNSHLIGLTDMLVGLVYSSQNKYSSAVEKFTSAIKYFESLGPDLTDQERISIFNSQTIVYQYLQKSFISNGEISSALEVAERGRGRALVDLLFSSTKNTERNSLDLEFNSKGYTINDIKKIAKNRNSTLVIYSLISDSKKLNLINLLGLKGISSVSEILIYVVQPNGNFSVRSVDLEVLKIKLSDIIAKGRMSIGVRDRSSIKIVSDVSLSVQQLHQLHNVLIKPIISLLPTDPSSQIIFVPQGDLFLIPFPALVNESGQYLVENHTILTAPSVQVLEATNRFKSKLTSSQGEALVIGNPVMPSVTVALGQLPEQLLNLPGAEQEANTIAKIFKTNPLTGIKASKKEVLRRISKAQWIHFATHGLLDNMKGLGSPGAIALAPSGNGELNDGLLTTDEILSMRLNAELVVLSACDTGRGRITGDGVLGLSRAFVAAGVPSVIVSLWAVSDNSTVNLMTEFYQNWRDRGMDKAQALRQAMLTTMKTHPNPRDWAAFTLIGEAK